MFGLVPYNKRDANIFRYMDDLEKSFWGDGLDGNKQFRCDISDKKDHYLLEAELPGFDKKDIHIALDNDVLTISAEHTSETEEKDKKSGYIRRERRYGSFARSFDVADIDADGIKADYKNGVLELNLPKKKELEAPVAKKIEIGG